MNKLNLIILARTEEPIDLNFYKTMLRQRNALYKKAVVLLFSDVEQFLDFLSGMDSSYSFILLIHAGIQNSTKGEDAIVIPRELREHDLCRKMKFNFISREGLQDQYYKGEKIFHANFLADEDLNTFPLNILGKIRGEEIESTISASPAEKSKDNEQSIESFDFAILTALYDKEFMVYETACNLFPTQDLLNAKKAKFKEKIQLSHGPDYEGKFLVSHQERMGLVDAAVNTSQSQY